MRPTHDRNADKRVLRLQMQIQSMNQEKVLMLQEIQKLKNEIRRPMITPPSLLAPQAGFSGGSLNDDVSLISWNRLIDSNVRRGTMTCMYCLKYCYTKKISLAFHKWLYSLKGFSSRQPMVYNNVEYSSSESKLANSVDEYDDGIEVNKADKDSNSNNDKNNNQFVIDQELEMRRNAILNNAFRLLRVDTSYDESPNTSGKLSGRRSPVSNEYRVPSPKTLYNSSFNGYSSSQYVVRNIQFNNANSSDKSSGYGSQNNHHRRSVTEQTPSYKNPTHSFKKKINKDSPSPKSWLRDGMANGFFTTNDIQGPLHTRSPLQKVHSEKRPTKSSLSAKSGGSKAERSTKQRSKDDIDTQKNRWQKIDPAQLRLFRGQDETKVAKQTTRPMRAMKL